MKFDLYGKDDHYIGFAQSLAAARVAARTLLGEGEDTLIEIRPDGVLSLERWSLDERGNIIGISSTLARKFEST